MDGGDLERASVDQCVHRPNAVLRLSRCPNIPTLLIRQSVQTLRESTAALNGRYSDDNGGSWSPGEDGQEDCFHPLLGALTTLPNPVWRAFPAA